MTRRQNAIRQLVSTSLALFALGFVVLHCTGCASATPQEKAAAADASYRADMLNCVVQSATQEDSQKCRAKVREQWRVDAGPR
jgi:hypothetical protein